MKNLSSSSIIFLLLFCISAHLSGAIPAQERAALIALFNATNGNNWKNNSGWKTPPLHSDGFAMPGTEGSWKGITVEEDSVIQIALDENALTGSIPAELGNIGNLENISMLHNQLNGIIPSELGSLSNLTRLHIQLNQLNGNIPPELANLTNLIEMDIGFNQLSGNIPKEFGNLTNLKTLNLEYNQLSGSIPAELGHLCNLKVLELRSNQLTGSIPSELGNLENLTILRLSSNQLSGGIPPELGNLDNLNSLMIVGTNLSGSIPSELGNLKNLTDMDLSRGKLSGSIPPELGNLSNLSNLELENNQLSGSIPPELGKLSKLGALVLASNQLSGSIPPELGSLSDLRRLLLCYNQLSGSIPPELGNLTYLTELVLFSNQLSGNIPSELGNLSNLNILYLIQNELSGSIPTELGNLCKLNSLYLASNHLSGEIPSSFTNLTNIGGFSINENCLFATDTSLRAWLYAHQRIWEENQNHCGGTGPAIMVVSPNGEENWAIGTSQTIIWTSTGTVGNVKIEYSINSGYSCSTIIASTANTGSHIWIVPDTASAECIVKISEVGDGSPSDISNNIFSIISASTPTITVTHPNGGENWSVGTSQTISWSTTGIVGNVKIEYSINSGSRWSTIIASTANTGSYVWTVPDTVSAGCMVKISEAGNGNPSDLSNNIFSIVSTSTPTITVIYPNGGETCGIGTSQTISWSNTGTVGNVKIEYSINGGSILSNIISSTSNTGSYTWIVPNPVSTQCRIKISAVDDPNIWDTSNANFSITSDSPPAINLNRKQMRFTATSSGTKTKQQHAWITNTGVGTLNWTVNVDTPWLSCTPLSGIDDGIIYVSVDPTGLSSGTYTGSVLVSDPNATNSPQTIAITLNVISNDQNKKPFGEFSTPIDGSPVSSSIPVTGWALDDVGVDSVKVYREEGNKSLVFIGDALFVEGARPDVEAAYPDYPNNYIAGWGYMLLTNFLPNEGNGEFTLHVIATDIEGKSEILGTKTIIVDNTNAQKPFGALDTPTQGGQVSGNNFINWGWALTPQPNMIPTDGTTINVWIDGKDMGHPVYNIFRNDIATLFPGYANSNGAVGYLSLDTTDFKNGLHTIQWTVMDNDNNTDGVGSRYFSILNTGNKNRSDTLSNEKQMKFKLAAPEELYNLESNHNEPVTISRGYKDSFEPQLMFPDNKGKLIITVKELERLEVHFFNSDHGTMTGKSIQAIAPLPVGSALDSDTGVFFWQLGVGFVGQFEFVFIERSSSGQLIKKEMIVNVIPK